MQIVKHTITGMAFIGLVALAFLGGMATRTHINLSVSVSSGAQAAEQEAQLNALTSSLPMGIVIDPPHPQRKPKVR